MAGQSSGRVIAYFLIAFGLNWLIWGAMLWYQRADDHVIPQLAFLLSVWGPLVAAISLTWRDEGFAGVRQLLARGLRWRVRWYWYAIVLVAYPFVVSGVTAGLAEVVSLGGIPMQTDLSLRLLLGTLFVSAVVLVFEEYGWRGYALPRLQAKLGAWHASLLIGVLWGVWHLPLWLLQPQRAMGGPFALAFGVFVFGCIAASVLYTCVYNGTGGSLLLVGLIHGVDDVLVGWVWATDDADKLAWLAVFLCVQAVAALLLLWRFGPARLTSVAIPADAHP
ncbi:MAG TPA: type II CAAX endopeptidase family protein [Rhodanobacteraceae bacterium]|nr:type II CAAX endopeptidase family protein [Rhodanobacteraceae bacterium]